MRRTFARLDRLAADRHTGLAPFDETRGLPRPQWPTASDVFVAFAQTVCLPTKPKCAQCNAGGAGLCPRFRAAAAPRVKAEAEADEHGAEPRGGRG